MSFEDFQARICSALNKQGFCLDSVRFSRSNGKYIAKIGSEAYLTGNSVSSAIYGSFGSGHLAKTAI